MKCHDRPTPCASQPDVRFSFYAEKDNLTVKRGFLDILPDIGVKRCYLTSRRKKSLHRFCYGSWYVSHDDFAVRRVFDIESQLTLKEQKIE